jgi:hypothetical protein
MAVVPQIITETKASGAQVIDGSLKFDQSTKTYLTRTPASAGNRKVWTLSYWIRLDGDAGHLFSANNDGFQFEYRSTGQLLFANSGSTSGNTLSTALFRDPNAFYHIVIQHDALNTISRFYINGEQNFTATLSNADGTWNNNTSHNINGRSTSIDSFSSFAMSQVYLIDGQALGPESFGYTDGLTNTWRPKKYTGEFTSYNANAINDGSNWNSYFTGDYDQNHGWGTLYQSSNAFDGNLSTKAIGQANSTGLTWTAPGGGIGASATTIRIYGNDDACPDDYLKINGVNYGGLITQGFTAAYTVLKGSGAVGGGITQLESIYLRDNASGNTHYRWIALEIDGVVLVANQDDRSEGTNSFYLPMDGNSPIGEDKSGQGNDWTPVNFGGSVALPKATGAKPILNTDGGGNVARPGVFGSEVGAQYTTTSATNSGGKYVFENEGTQPTFSFIRGATYTFDYNASTGHPLRFATAADAAGSTQYTDGTNTSVSNVISFTVPHNAPNTLHYYCTNHSGMGNSISVTTDETKADPYAWKNTLALPLVGSKRMM